MISGDGGGTSVPHFALETDVCNEEWRDFDAVIKCRLVETIQYFWQEIKVYRCTAVVFNHSIISVNKLWYKCMYPGHVYKSPLLFPHINLNKTLVLNYFITHLKHYHCIVKTLWGGWTSCGAF